MVDQMHVVDARRAGRHAGQAGQAAVDMGDGLLVGRAAVFQHVLDEINPPARAVELIAERHIGRAGRRAEAAMHAFAQDRFGLRDMRVGELGEGEGGLHSAHPPRIENPHRIKLLLQPLRQAASAGGCGSKTGMVRRCSSLARISVAWPPPCFLISARSVSASGSPSHADPDQPALPVVEGVGGGM